MTETTYRVKANNEAPRNSRSFLDGLRDDLEPRFDDVAIVVSELVTNSVRHSNDDLTVTVVPGPDSIRIEVADWGPGFNRDAPRGDGMGLNIVEKIATDWGVTLDGVCTVWVEIPRQI
jgi:anti-sigma regulatory factor (Ser/Thr protein kinase)